MNKKFMIGGCAVAAVAGNVFAADEDISYFNPYASLKGGYAYLSKRNDIKYKGGFAGAVELGVSYDAWRLGLELGYKSNKVKEINSGYNTAGMNAAHTDAKSALEHCFGVHGKLAENKNTVTLYHFDRVNALTGMVNVYYDYAMTEAWSIYAGLGLGVAKVSYRVDKMYQRADILDRNYAANTWGTSADIFGVSNADLAGYTYKGKTELSKTVFAWQLMAGVGYEFNESWKLTFGYKLFNTAKVEVFGGKKIKTPFNHTAEIGLTYAF